MQHSNIKTDPFFYSEHIPAVGELVTIMGNEARHISASRRLCEGDQLWLFDGAGRVAQAEILDIRERGKELDLKIRQCEIIPPVDYRIVLVSALPKGDRLGVLLDMATQLGMSEFIPLMCERSIRTPGGKAWQRWHRICLEASKQSRRAYLPVIHEAVVLDQALALAKANKADIIVADPAGESLVHCRSIQDCSQCYVFIGPEGGFTEKELDKLANANAMMINLGPGILRIEVAAMTLIAQIKLIRP